MTFVNEVNGKQQPKNLDHQYYRKNSNQAEVVKTKKEMHLVADVSLQHTGAMAA